MLIVAALLAGSALQAPPARVHNYGGVALSPSGDRVLTIESQEAAAQPSKPSNETKAPEPGKAPGAPSEAASGRGGLGHAVILVRAVADGRVVASFDPCPTCSYAGATFSPGGGSIAFMAAEPRTATATLMTAEVATPKHATVVAQVKGVAETPRWSPDGRMLAILATPGARKQTGATQAGIPQVGEIGVEGADDEQRIGVVPATGGEIRYVSPADTFVYEYGWAADGKGFVATAAKGNGDNNWWVAKVEHFGLDGAERVIAAPKFQMNMPRATADGRSVAFIGGLMSDFGPVGGDLYLAPIGGGAPVDITPDFKGTFTSLTERPNALYATALVGAKTTVFKVDVASRNVTPIYSTDDAISAGDGRIALSDDGRIAAASLQSFETAPALMAGPIGAWKKLTHDNDSAPPQVSAKSITWKSDGYDVQGWLLGPRNATPGKTYPMIVSVHGGPSSAWTPGYVGRGTTYDLVSHGYYVFEPNPRGSYGQGEAFTRANVRDLGGGDLGDILRGVDAVEKVAPIDDKRLGVYGHSYGGFMTMWSVTHTNRFHAAVAGAGIANWSSYYGENGIAEWMPPFFGESFYNDPAIYDKLSPIRYIKNAKTPTFIYVGERDVECPAPQSLEFFAGLKAEHVPASLVIYEGEGHGIRSPEHNRDLTNRIVGWFDKYLAAPSQRASTGEAPAPGL